MTPLDVAYGVNESSPFLGISDMPNRELSEAMAAFVSAQRAAEMLAKNSEGYLSEDTRNQMQMAIENHKLGLEACLAQAEHLETASSELTFWVNRVVHELSFNPDAPKIWEEGCDCE